MKLTNMSFLLLAGLILSGVVNAQDKSANHEADTAMHKPCDNPTTDTSHIGPVVWVQKKCDGKVKNQVIIWGPTTISANKATKLKNVYLSWFGFDLGFDNYIDKSAYGTSEVNNFVHQGAGQQQATSDMFSLRQGKSVNVNIWPVLLKANLIDHALWFKTGVGIEMNNYRYTKNISYANSIDKTYIFQDSVSFKKNKLFTEYLTIPLMLDFEPGTKQGKNSFHLAAGATFGYLVKSRTKQVSRARGKEKDNNPFNLEKFRTGLRAEIGYKWLTLYGAYSFTPIHQYGLKQYPFSIGLALIR